LTIVFFLVHHSRLKRKWEAGIGEPKGEKCQKLGEMIQEEGRFSSRKKKKGVASTPFGSA